nr:VIT domain-containing protein [Kofleriaceae bacterium]
MSNSNQESNETDDVLEQNITSLLSNAKTPPQMSAIGRARVRAALLAKHGTLPTRRRTPWLVGGVALAAAASVAVWYGTQHRGAPSTGANGSAAPAGVASVSGDMQKFADGSVVWLRDGAKVTEVGPRHVSLIGEALFDVSPGTVPFTVDSPAAHIAVLGTRFVVAATADDTSAAVIRGVVKLGNAQGDVTLHAGDQGRATAHTVPVRGPAPRLSQLVGWAQAARARDERGLRTGVRNGTLYARLPNSQGVESPLPMTALHIDAVVENRIARVALDQTFLNTQPYEQEGMYRFAIPSDAALQRFAMYVDGTLTESVVTDRMRARRVYEDLVYRRIDPGLLEYAGEGRLEMKVYPLRANAEKRLAVVYTQSLPQLYDTWSLRVPIPDVDQAIEQVDFAVRIADCANCEVRSTSHQINVTQQGVDTLVSYRASNVQAGDSLVLQVRDTRRQATVATAADSHGQYLMVRAPLPTKANAAPLPYVPRTWVVLNDVSASRTAMDRHAQAAIIDRALQEIDEDDQVAVLSFDVTARVNLPMVNVRAADRKKLAEVLLKQETGGVGATDMGAALTAAMAQFDQHAAGQPAATRMLMYIGDGV